jgi:hypothetical protein
MKKNILYYNQYNTQIVIIIYLKKIENSNILIY